MGDYGESEYGIWMDVKQQIRSYAMHNHIHTGVCFVHLYSELFLRHELIFNQGHDLPTLVL